MPAFCSELFGIFPNRFYVTNDHSAIAFSISLDFWRMVDLCRLIIKPISGTKLELSVAEIVRGCITALERVGQLVGVFTHEQSLLGQKVLAKKAAEAGDAVPFAGELDAIAIDHNRARFGLFGQTNVHQAVFAHVLGGENVVELGQLYAPASLLQFFQDVEGQ